MLDWFPETVPLTTSIFLRECPFYRKFAAIESVLIGLGLTWLESDWLSIRCWWSSVRLFSSASDCAFLLSSVGPSFYIHSVQAQDFGQPILCLVCRDCKNGRKGMQWRSMRASQFSVLSAETVRMAAREYSEEVSGTPYMSEWSPSKSTYLCNKRLYKGSKYVNNQVNAHLVTLSPL